LVKENNISELLYVLLVNVSFSDGIFNINILLKSGRHFVEDMMYSGFNLNPT